MLSVGWHYLENSDPLPALGSATFLDVGGAEKGMQSPLRLCRLYYKGRPDIANVITKALGWAKLGCKVQLLNECNHPIEQFDGTPADYAALYYQVKALAPEVPLYWAAPSPGFPGWEAWYNGAENADGITVHEYGTFSEMGNVVNYVRERFPGKPIWVSECNFGPDPDRVVDRNAWGREHLQSFLDWCSQWPQIEAVSYFAYKWPTPDLESPTPVDGAGTEIETVLRNWEGEQDMPGSLPSTTTLEDVMADMWKRQGVNLNRGDAFFRFACEQARTTGVFIIPQPSTDGNYYTYVGDYIIGYTFPPIYCRQDDMVVKAGLPPFT